MKKRNELERDSPCGLRGGRRSVGFVCEALRGMYNGFDVGSVAVGVCVPGRCPSSLAWDAPLPSVGAADASRPHPSLLFITER